MGEQSLGEGGGRRKWKWKGKEKKATELFRQAGEVKREGGRGGGATSLTGTNRVESGKKLMKLID